MGLTYIGLMPLSALVPVVYTSIGEVAVALSAALQGNLALHASLLVTPPTLAAAITAATEFQAQLTVAIAAVPPVPAVSFTVTDCINLIASLNAGLSLLVTLDALLVAAAGIYSFGYSGAGNVLGVAVTSELASTWPDSAPTNTSTTALVFGAVANASLSPPTIAAQQMASFLGGLTFGPGLVYGGKIGLSALSPVTVAATAQGAAGIQTQLNATAALQASLSVTPPTLVATLNAFAGYLAHLSAQVSVPDASALLAATASAAASLSANFGLLCALGATLARADAQFFVYSYTGLGNALGPNLTTALASTWGDGTTPTSGACTAAVLGATDTLSATTMLSFFGGA